MRPIYFRARIARLGLMAVVLLYYGVTQSAERQATTPQFYRARIQPLLEKYCFQCHSTEKHKGDLDLERFSSVAMVLKQPQVWQIVVEQLSNHEMPPKDKTQPTSAERQVLVDWSNAVLEKLALQHAGDPGPVMLRRLSNPEYTYTVRDLTGVQSLDPAFEFPVDGAAGEGFLNTGNALVMSPTLVTKYLNAGKSIANHAVLLPDGVRFSPSVSRRDWTEEILGQIRAFYRRFTDPRGGDKVNLQGIVFETNEGGRLPLEKYLAATLQLREASGPRTNALPTIARQHGLSPKYLATLWHTLTNHGVSPLLQPIQRQWRAAAPADLESLSAHIVAWQKALWKFGSVGHIGKAGGPKSWLEPVDPVANRQEFRLKIPTAPEDSEITLYLAARDAGDGNTNDFVIWEDPRFVAPGRPDLRLRDARRVASERAERRAELVATTAAALAAAAEAATAPAAIAPDELAAKHGVATDLLSAWFSYLGIDSQAPRPVEGHLTNILSSNAGYDFIKGWGSSDTPSLIANASDQTVRIPGTMKAHSIAVHPSPKLRIGIGWRSPIAGVLGPITAQVTHAHPECGNGVTWFLELRSGKTRRRLAAGTAQGPKEISIGPIDPLNVRLGDVLSLLIGPRDGNHSCDLTAVDLNISSREIQPRSWHLAREISPDVLAGNPHADRFGNADVWHFYVEPDKDSPELDTGVPAGSVLAQWQNASSQDEKRQWAEQVQRLLQGGAPEPKESPDAKLYRVVSALGGPLLSRLVPGSPPSARAEVSAQPSSTVPVTANRWGLDPSQFGRRADGSAIPPANLFAHAPTTLEVRLPADLIAGCEFVTTGFLDSTIGAEGTVQLQVLTAKQERASALQPSTVTVTARNGMWTSDNRSVAVDSPIIARDGSAARQRVTTAFDEFRAVFPAALCYTKIVPVDEVVTLTLFYREDHHLARLMLDDRQKAALDQLWSELHYVSQDALTLVDAFEQLWQFATQDADPKVFEPLRKPIQDRAAAFRQSLLASEPKHLQAIVDFAARVYRRPLTSAEAEDLRALYRRLRREELSHDQAMRLVVARLFIAPAFLYRLEKTGPGTQASPVSSFELANRLSYFLWSSLPDDELLKEAAAGTLPRSNAITRQTQRMLRDPRSRRLATEFACQWLHIRDFDTLEEKSERHFPEFLSLRRHMYEESILFFTDLFQHDRSVLNILDADYTFLNEPLAQYYGVPNVTGAEWRRVDQLKALGRGGVLGQAAILAKHSGASRTSPILRGNWVAEVLLGDKLPRPPKDVPLLPEDESTETLTVRQLTERHTSDPLCSGCHARIDPFGFALENFDAIGRKRTKDLGDRPLDTRTRTLDGAEFAGLEGLRTYLLTRRRDAFVGQFCRKLLGYALGRSVQLSDQPLLKEMQQQLRAQNYRVSAAIETVVRSRQFREIRGVDFAAQDRRN